jgi:spermidine synthase
VPISYFYPTGPAGQVFRALSENGFDKPVAIVGLGAGALACYGKPGQIFTFYEIDPLVERIARDADLFTYLKGCSPRTSVRIGDARLTLASAPDRYYGMFILDAFSGDSIPIHLLTQEAVELYLSKLVPEGVLLFHISNRYMNLAPVIDRVATELKLTAFLRDDSEISEIEKAEGKQPSSWVIMARQNKVLAAFDNDKKWKALVGNLKSDLWTDNYSNILQALRWQ